MKKTPMLISVIIFLVTGLVIAQIVVSNSIATGGAEVGGMQSRIADLQKENMMLKAAIYQNASLTHIASAAAATGFVEKTSEIMLTSPLPIALRQ